MDVITRATHPSLYWPGVRNIFGMGYREGEHVFRQFVKVKKSNQAEEKMVEMVGLGLVPEVSELQPYTLDKTSEGAIVRASHVGYSLGVSISREAIDDNKYPQTIGRYAQALLRSARQTLELIGHLPLNQSFDPLRPFANTGAALCSANHPSRAGLQSNVLPVPADLSELAIETLVTIMGTSLDQRGLQSNTKPTKLIMHPANDFESGRILMSTKQANSDSNNANILKERRIIPAQVSSPYIEDQDAWWLMGDGPEPAITMFERKGFEVSEHTDHKTKATDTSVYFRTSVVASDWHSIYGSQGS